MSGENFNHYVNALSDQETPKFKDEVVTLYLSTDSIYRLKKIKKFTEMKNNIIINMAITFFFNSSSAYRDHYSFDAEGRSVAYIATLKNEQRVAKQAEEKGLVITSMFSIIATIGINILYEKLLGKKGE